MPNNSVWDDRSKRWITVDPSAAQNQWNWVQGAIGGSPVTTKPNVPVMPSTSGMYGNVPTSSGAKPLTYTMPDFSSIIKQINDLNLKAQQASNAGRIPNAGGLENQSSTNIGYALSGELPPNLLQGYLADRQQTNAENAVGMGRVGSQATDAGLNKLLINERLARLDQGQNWLNAAYARNPGAPVSTIDPSTLYPSVGQQLQSDLALRNLEMQQQELAQRYDLAMREMANRLAVAGLQHQGNARTSPYSGGSFTQPSGTTPTGSPYIFTGSTSTANPNATPTMSSRTVNANGTPFVPYNPVPGVGTNEYLDNLMAGNNFDYTGYNPYITSNPFAVENSLNSLDLSPYGIGGELGNLGGLYGNTTATTNPTSDWFNQDWLYGG